MARRAALENTAKKKSPYKFYKVRALLDHLQKNSAPCALSGKRHFTQKCPGLHGMGVRRKQYTDGRAYLKYMTDIKEKRRRSMQ